MLLSGTNDRKRILRIAYPGARSVRRNRSVRSTFLVFGICRPLGLRRGLLSWLCDGRKMTGVYGLGPTLLYSNCGFIERRIIERKVYHY